jgi:replication factor C large subunit
MSQGLRGATRDIEFRDVSKRSIVPVLRDLCRRENIDYDDEALDALAEKNAGDLRSAINDLQALAEDDRTLEKEDVVTGERDRTTGIFDFLDALIKEEGPECALKASYDIEETPDDLLNWVDENMPKDYHGKELANAYDALAKADVWLGRVRATQNYSYWRYATDNITAGVAAAREGKKGGWTRYGPPSYWSKLGRTRGTRDTRDYIARKIAERAGCSMATARREIMPFLAAMTHHCKPRDLTVRMAAAYEMEEKHVSYITGSGESTNKVESIVADAEEMREEAMEAHTQGAFEGTGEATEIEIGDGDEDEAEEPAEEAGEPEEEEADENQSGLGDFM